MLVGGGVCAWLVYQAPFLGHDWIVGFAPEVLDDQYPPWITLLLRPLTALPPRTGLAIINGLSLSSAAVLCYRYGRLTFPETRVPAVFALLFALVNPIPWILLWLGQIEAIVMLGLISLPVGVPLLFAKPNIGPWSAISSRRNLLWMLVFLAVTLVLWGFWPDSIIAHTFIHRIPHPISIGWGSIHPAVGVLGLVLVLFTSRDPLRLMAAGSLVSPFVMPYHYYVLLPALGRVRGYRQGALWAACLFLLLEIGIETLPVKILGLALPLMVWVFLSPTLNPRAVLTDPDAVIHRIRASALRSAAWLAAKLTSHRKAT